MIQTAPPVRPSVIHRLFYNRSELRAGLRLFIFLAVVIALINASNVTIRRLLSGADDTTSFLVREVMDFLIFLSASWIMGRIEGRTIADYGLPWAYYVPPAVLARRSARFRVDHWPAGCYACCWGLPF